MSSDLIFPAGLQFNDGEELTHADLNTLQQYARFALLSQALDTLAPQFRGSVNIDFWGIDHGFDVQFARCLHPGVAALQQGSTNSKIALGFGPIFQPLGQVGSLPPAGDLPNLTPFFIDDGAALPVGGVSNQDMWTLTNGDATNPRVDLLQISLTTVSAAPTSRVTQTVPVKASLNLVTLTAHVNTIVRAIVSGLGGDQITMALQKRTTGTGVTYSESGNTITILYQTGVSTVLNIETAITANSTLIEIQSAGTPASVLTDPADTFAATHLTGGVNALTVSSTLSKRLRVQCAPSVVVGTPAASPQIPDPTVSGESGCVVGYAVVGNGWTTGGNAPIFGKDAVALNNVSVHDLRIPLGVRSFTVDPTAYRQVAGWSTTNSGNSVTATSGTNTLYVPCPCRHGRLLGYSIWRSTRDPGNLDASFGTFGSLQSPTLSSFLAANLVGVNASANATNSVEEIITSFTFERLHSPDVGPAIRDSPSHSVGVPVWSNGLRGPRAKFNASSGFAACEQLSVRYTNMPNGCVLGPATFWIACGL
jgi:hypothetical protein